MLGISMKDYTAIIEKGDGKGAMIMMLEALQKTQGIKRSQIMKEMFGEQATRHVNSLVEGLDSLKKNFAMVADETEYAGSMQREFSARSATTENNIQLLKNQMAILATNVGSALLPTINSVVGIFGKAANTIAEFAEKHPTLIKYIGLVVAGMASMKIAGFAVGYAFTFLKGGVLTIMGVFSQARTVFSLAKMGIGTLAPVLKILNMAFVSSPIGLIIAGIAAGAYLIITNWQWCKDMFWKIVGGIGDAFDWVWGIIKGVWDKITGVISGIADAVSNSMLGRAWKWMFGSDDKKSKPAPQTKVGDTVSETIINAPSATPLPRSNVSNSNMSNVSVSAPITINASPGMSETEIAKQVSRELDSREQSAMRRQRGVNYD
jgi:hypothetical protein